MLALYDPIEWLNGYGQLWMPRHNMDELSLMEVSMLRYPHGFVTSWKWAVHNITKRAALIIQQLGA